MSRTTSSHDGRKETTSTGSVAAPHRAGEGGERQPLECLREDGNIDESALGEIARLELRGSPGLVVKVVAAYQANAQESLAFLQRSLDLGNREDIRRAAHTLKGSSQQVGATMVVRLCALLEHSARDADFDALGQVLAQIKNQVEVAGRRLLHIVATNRTSDPA